MVFFIGILFMLNRLVIFFLFGNLLLILKVLFRMFNLI